MSPVSSLHHILADPAVRQRLAQMRATPSETAAQLAAQVREQLAAIPRGQTPRARAASAARRRDMADPIKRKAILDRLAAARDTDSWRQKRAAVPRCRGKWVATLKKRMGRPNRSRFRAAMRARARDPQFRARMLVQLAAARAKEMERRRLARIQREGVAS